ncbi:T9SS C-terminal target domain-containing protein [Sphingobacteriales bacterium UPWRP_1]|nr:hypothetical protein BVG80_17875 [Sphingobacteriales bacterium TSM_CSM]PSJ73907.1 T9SS C-terminal target domain-containing protein [Sphingobacteriales bacterium UPWRP_1]
MTPLVRFICIAFVVVALLSGYRWSRSVLHQPKETSEAGAALQCWAFQRAYPGKNIDMRRLSKAFEQQYGKAFNTKAATEAAATGTWRSLGPKNIGGRTLCLAFNPFNPNTLYVGSASGGLWRSFSGGEGQQAWHRVETGFPVLGVSAIAVSPLDSNVLYLGTGEVYNYQNTMPGIAIRTTRGSYGIGILKTTDGGQTWSKSLDWSYTDLRGVQDLAINPLNPNTVFAATTEGIFRSQDAGNTWQQVSSVIMATGIDICPADTALLLATHGGIDNSAVSGIYRSADGGNSFTKITAGLPESFGGKAVLNFSPVNAGIVYASVAEPFNSIGLYRSVNAGLNWELLNSEDVAKHQGWYSHDVAVNPQNGNELLYVGIDVWKSEDAGITFEQKTYWYNWFFGQVPVGGPEGPCDYVHGDIHAVYYSPFTQNTAFLVTDGGIFRTTDGGACFEGLNGGYQTTQFYANFASSQIDSAFAIGGMQDNATAIYTGSDAWTRVIGGDGLSAAIHPQEPDILFGSYQYLGLQRSDNGGADFYGIQPPLNSDDRVNFAAPYELAPANPQIMYAGSNFLYRSTDAGLNWERTSSVAPDGDNPVLAIAIANNNPDRLYFSTSPNSLPPAKVFTSINGGATFQNITANLPNRLITDIALHPQNADIAYVTLSGFGTPHVYMTEDAGLNWIPLTDGLPDVPANALLIDPDASEIVYVGNDLGVYYSLNSGNNWQWYGNGLPHLAMVMHLGFSPVNQKVRIATHGNGVYEADAVTFAVSSQAPAGPGISNLQLFPNPAQQQTTLQVNAATAGQLALRVYSATGILVATFAPVAIHAGQNSVALDLGSLTSAGVYLLHAQFCHAPVTAGRQCEEKLLKLVKWQ